MHSEARNYGPVPPWAKTGTGASPGARSVRRVPGSGL